MGFFPSLAGVIRAASLASIAVLFAASASAETIPGPPIGGTASDRAGDFCSLREGGASGNAVAFAAGVVIVAIAARRRGDA